MSTRQARVAALTEDVATLTEKVTALHEDFERALEELEESDTSVESVDDPAVTPADEATAEPPRADGGNVGWEEIETAGPDGSKDAESVEWTPVDQE